MSDEYKALPIVSKDIDLKPLDVVSYVGKKDNAFHKAIRSITAGFGNRNNIDIPVHSGIVVKYKGKLVIAEMKAQGKNNGLKFNPIENDKSFIKGVTRFKLNKRERNSITNDIINDYENKDIKYAKKSAPINFLFKNKEKKDLKSAICSEYVARKIEKGSRYDVLKKWHRVMPADLARMDTIAVSKPDKKKIRGSKIEFIPIGQLIRDEFSKVAALFMR
jgi:hypothetical protein